MKKSFIIKFHVKTKNFKIVVVFFKFIFFVIVVHI